MFKHLRRRLTILFSVLTAAVLAAALTATCRMAQNEAVSGADLVFANTVSAIEDAVTENNLVRDSWLARKPPVAWFCIWRKMVTPLYSPAGGHLPMSAPHWWRWPENRQSLPG